LGGVGSPWGRAVEAPKHGTPTQFRVLSDMKAEDGKTGKGGQGSGRSIRESGEVFRMIVENANEAILVAQDGMLTFVNPKTSDLIGFSAQELTRKPFVQFLHPEDRNLVSERHQRRLRGEELDNVYPCRILHREGGYIWAELNAVLFAWEGRPATLIFVNDITSRRKAEEALRESEEKYRQLFSTESDAILLFFADSGEIMDVNEAASRLYGHDRETFLSLKITDVSAEPDATRSSVAETIAGKISKIPFRYHLRRDGTRFPVEISTSTFLLHNRKVLCAAVRDISNRVRMEEELKKHRDELEKLVEARTSELEETNRQLRREIEERARAEASLRRREEQYSTLVEDSLTGIYIDQDEKIVFANQRFAEIYGYAREEILGLPTWKLVHPDDRPLTDQIRARRLRGEPVAGEYEARGLNREGEILWIKRRNTLIEFKGRPAILGNIVDVSERKLAEEELRKTNEDLKSFLHVVTHDLKNPIITIQGFSARLLKRYRGVLEEKGAGYIHQIRSSARRMEILVSDLMALSIVGRVVHDFTDVPLEELFRDVVSGLEHRFNETGFRWVLESPLPTVRCDRDRIYQVFENLLSNAFKFRGEAENPEVRVGCVEKEESVRLYVKDNGIGIAPEYHEKVFDMFFRVQQVKDESGTGLGLAIVRKIVKNHGGRVWVESEKGKGAAFFFMLPRSPREA
jgi:PAS domain S-box-containing protein